MGPGAGIPYRAGKRRRAAGSVAATCAAMAPGPDHAYQARLAGHPGGTFTLTASFLKLTAAAARSRTDSSAPAAL